jgi:aquaporin NIP
MLKKCVSEFIGTFALVFCGTGAIIIDQVSGGAVTHVGVAITFGLIVLAMIYTFGNISGAHLNPAVSIGFYIVKRFEKKLLLPYISSQLFGALMASAILKLLFPENHDLGSTIPAGSDMQSFILEFILTFFLMLVILNVSQGSKETGVMAGIAIGATVLLEAMFAGPICGASMNPARSIAPAVFSMNFGSLWLYIVAPVGGALFAACTGLFLNGTRKSAGFSARS